MGENSDAGMGVVLQVVNAVLSTQSSRCRHVCQTLPLINNLSYITAHCRAQQQLHASAASYTLPSPLRLFLTQPPVASSSRGQPLCIP